MYLSYKYLSKVVLFFDIEQLITRKCVVTPMNNSEKKQKYMYKALMDYRDKLIAPRCATRDNITGVGNSILVVHLIKEVTPLIATADRRHLIEYKLSIQGVKLL